MNRRRTIKDIAKLAGVSVSTVSRVLNNANDVNEETRTRILGIIETLHYNPNPAAMALVSRKSKYVAVVVPNIHHYVHSKMVQGIMDVLQVAGFDVLLFDYNESSEIEARYYKNLESKMIDGLILITSIADESHIIAIAETVPTVLIEREVVSQNVDSVLVDEENAMLQLMQYLKVMGHRKVGLINGAENTSSAIYRLAAFEKALKTEEMDSTGTYVIHTEWSLIGGKQAFIHLMREKAPCTAYICSSDQLAIGALGGAYDLKMRIPEDVSIVGFDNFQSGEISIPPLSTLDFPSDEMGREAARCILERINNQRREPKTIVLPVTILPRESVKRLSELSS